MEFDQALKMSEADKKHHSTLQSEDDRKAMDKKWDKLNATIASKNPNYVEP